LIDIKIPQTKKGRDFKAPKNLKKRRKEEKMINVGRVYSLLMKDAEHITIDIIRANNQARPESESLGICMPKSK
jgi:hypothetical protein